jgi:hypothetical protein
MYIVSKITEQAEATNTIDSLFGDVTYIVSDTSDTRTIVASKATSNKTSKQDLMRAYNKLYNIGAKYLDNDMEEHYTTFRIPKKTHGFRTIKAPADVLKEDCKAIVRILKNDLHLLHHNAAWAYVKGRDVVSAMRVHQENKSRWFLKIDLKDFFGSCSPAFIMKQLMQLYPFAQYEDEATQFILQLCKIATLADGLPQGTPLSPMLTNLVMVPIDYAITRMLNDYSDAVQTQRYIYTRYADDIIISAKEKFDHTKIVKAIELILKDTPLKINTEKTRFGSFAGRNWNLGIMYNKDKELTTGYRNKQFLKKVTYRYVKDKNDSILWPLEDLRWYLGQLSWLANVEPMYTTGVLTYYQNKYNIDVRQSIITDIKSYNN